MTKKSSQYLVWMDLEMTGLDPETATIIEIATIITDSEINIIAEGPVIAIHQSDKILNAMDDWNTKQHTHSGLVERVRQSSISMAEAEKMTLEFVDQYCRKGKSPLCGNSIWHDRRFLIKYMTELNSYFHYRNIDVSTIKELVGRWYSLEKAAPKKKRLHLALDDIRESIQELVYYRDHVFVARTTQSKA